MQKIFLIIFHHAVSYTHLDVYKRQHDSRLFVKTLLEFSRAYNLKTVAEFVETGEIAKILMDLGVDYLQGFYFGHAYNFRPWINDDRIV